MIKYIFYIGTFRGSRSECDVTEKYFVYKVECAPDGTPEQMKHIGEMHPLYSKLYNYYRWIPVNDYSITLCVTLEEFYKE